MSNIGILSPIPKKYTAGSVGDNLVKHNMSRFPGATVSLTPAKGFNGRYKTGLDDEAASLNNLSPEDKAAEVKRRQETRKRLENTLILDLSPTSQYYNIASQVERHVERVVIPDEGAVFNLDNPLEEVTWEWVCDHPLVASSLEAYQRGETFSGCQYYIQNKAVEVQNEYNKVKALHKAMSTFDEFSLTRQQQIARLMGIPAYDDSKSEELYTRLDVMLKTSKMDKNHRSRGRNPLAVYNEILKLTPDVVDVRSSILEAINFGVWYVGKTGEIMEAENKIADSEIDLEATLLNKGNQDQLLALKEKIKIAKIGQSV